jgi:Universal stress protein UspA and related nucleotide-binding proteins
MAFRDVLLTLTSYPEPTPVFVVEDAVAVAAALGAHIAGLSCEMNVQLPGHFISGSMVGLPGIIAGEAAKSRRNAQGLVASFEAAGAKAGVSRESILQKCKSFEVPDLLVEYARLRDLTIMPVPDSYDQWYAEAVIFGSGKPTLILPQSPRSRQFQLGTVAVAWDFSRAAARAVADAVPILEKAREVRIVTVANEKVLDSKHSAEELAKNLSRHGIDVVLDKVDAAGRTIGEVLEAYAASCKADILVMGAYGQSKFREFFLGGATKSLLSKPPIPILSSH